MTLNDQQGARAEALDSVLRCFHGQDLPPAEDVLSFASWVLDGDLSTVRRMAEQQARLYGERLVLPNFPTRAGG